MISHTTAFTDARCAAEARMSRAHQRRRGLRATASLTALSLAATMLVSSLPAQGGMQGNAHVIKMRGDSAQMIVNLLTIANRDAITAAQMASTKATRPDVKEFAKMLVTEHKNALEHIYDSAAIGGWVRRDTLPDSAADGMWGMGAEFSINAKQPDSVAQEQMIGEIRGMRQHDRDAIKKLSETSGPDFDQQFLATRIEQHKALVKALSNFSTSNVKLKEIIASTKQVDQRQFDRALILQGHNGRPK